MNELIIAALLLAAPPAGDGGAEAGTPQIYRPLVREEGEAKSPITLAHELRASVSDHLRREATTEGIDNRAAIIALVELHGRLSRDEYLTRDERIRLKAKVRSRLMQIQKRLRREIRLAKRRARREEPAAQQEAAAAIDFAARFDQHLFQLGRGIGAAGDTENLGEQLIDLIESTVRPASWEDRGGPGVIKLFPPLGALESWSETPGRISAKISQALGATGGAPEDYGEELVDLIQTVIAPHSWDINGGPGSIYYYRHLHVLVIRQTGQVHGRVGGALNNLRAAGN